MENFSELVAPICAVPCDFDGDGLISARDVRRLLYRLDIRNIKGCHGRILDVRPPVSPVVAIGWMLYALHARQIAHPERYVAAVLQDHPERRDAVPAPFETLAALSSDGWTLFAEHTWLRRYLGQGERVPIPDDLGLLYERWLSIYGNYPLPDLPLALGERALEHVQGWLKLTSARATPHAEG